MSDLWMTPSYRTRAWPYRGIPAEGDIIRYMNDGFDTTVQNIRRTRIVLSDGTVYRRRVDWGMIWAWIVSHKPERGNDLIETSATVSRPLRPVLPYVREVNLQL